MRKKIVAGNWKMNKNLSEGTDLANELSEILTSLQPMWKYFGSTFYAP